MDALKLIPAGKLRFKMKDGKSITARIIPLTVLLLLSSCALIPYGPKSSPKAPSQPGSAGKPLIYPAVLVNGQKAGDLILGETTLKQALKILPPWPAYPPGPIPLSELSPGYAGKVREVLLKAKKSYNPAESLFMLYFDENEKLIMIQDNTIGFDKQKTEAVKNIISRYPLKEVYRDSKFIIMQGEMQPCVFLEVMLDAGNGKNEPFEAGYLYTCPTK